MFIYHGNYLSLKKGTEAICRFIFDATIKSSEGMTVVKVHLCALYVHIMCNFVHWVYKKMVIVKQLFWYVLSLSIKQYNMLPFNAAQPTKDFKNVAQRLLFRTETSVFIYIHWNKREQSAFLQSTLISFERLKESFAIKHYIYAIHKSFVYGTIRLT